MVSPMEHIDHIRREKFSIGKELNPLMEDLHYAVKIFSAELYANDVHFIMELIQNAEDNEYEEGVIPSLEFIMTSQDITRTGASATLLIFNNEKGFCPRNIDSLCSVGRSTKKRSNRPGYIGEKGIGFKSVFLISGKPYIFSNGYHIRFSEESCSHCNVGYIVPEWVDWHPVMSDIKRVYGSSKSLPTTIIILPLKHDKVDKVKQRLSCIHPEVLLFLTKIRSLSLKEDSVHPTLSSFREVAIASEINFVTRKNVDAESYNLYLVASENSGKPVEECGYHMWRQRFPVKEDNRAEKRAEIEEWSITLAFPFGERLQSGKNSVGVYAYLPTMMSTNFPFIIQADFLLASSREVVLLDNNWNLGILGCVPLAFVNAFRSMVITSDDFPDFNIPNMFRFVPLDNCSFPQLNNVRDSIKALLLEENIIICESCTNQKLFAKPREVSRLMPVFWHILHEAKNQGLSLHSLSTHGVYILNSFFDIMQYNDILNFLGVNYVDSKWYMRCIRSCNLVLQLSEETYMELLLFISESRDMKFHDADFLDIPLLKYIDYNGNITSCSIKSLGKAKKLCMSDSISHISWLIDWNMESKCDACFFLPQSTQEAIYSFSKSGTVVKWLRDRAHVSRLTVYAYASLIRNSLRANRHFSLTYAHFLHHSLLRNFLSEQQVRHLCGTMPLVDNCGYVVTCRKGVLVPARESKWVQLIGTNPWRDQGYVELGEDYLFRSHSCKPTKYKEILEFLATYVGARDIPDLLPPDAEIHTFSGPLTKHNAFLLLDWIRAMRYKRIGLHVRFFSCIRKGCWLRTLLNGAPGFRSPSESFLPTSSWGDFLQNMSVLVDIPLVDERFYDNRIHEYKEELRSVGVRFEYGEACEYIGEKLMAMAAASSLTKRNVLSVLEFIRLSRQKMLPVDDFVNFLKSHKWLRTCLGDMAPEDTVLFDKGWIGALDICDIPFIQEDYYDNKMQSFKMELQLLGVTISFDMNLKIVLRYLKHSICNKYLGPDAFLFILQCIRHLGSLDKFSVFMKDKCLKTSTGYDYPGDCFMLSPEWGCLLRVFNRFALIDLEYYGSEIQSFRNELKQIGIAVDIDEAVIKFLRVFQQIALWNLIKKEHVLSILSAYRFLVGKYSLPNDLMKCFRAVKWLRTRLGDYRCPCECILFSSEWESISHIARLPFLDDSDECYGTQLHEFRKELESLGVVLQFRNGAKFVVSSIYLPEDPYFISPVSVFSLLDSIHTIKNGRSEPLSDAFLEKLSMKWVRTHFGYMAPNRSLLFHNRWSSYLHPEDGPFIDEGFYGSKLSSYEEELKAIGVVVDPDHGSELLFDFLCFHSKFATIVRIYHYLKKTNWRPRSSDGNIRIWIPNGTECGTWVAPEICSLYDRDRLFTCHPYILEKHYDQGILNFFSSAFKIKPYPSVEDYCKLWKSWECSSRQLSAADCGAFWGYVTRSLNHDMRKTLVENISKVPVCSNPHEIKLVDKGDSFIPDDLLLKEIFEKNSSGPSFVWYPRSDFSDLFHAKLLGIYREIGVKALSECVRMDNTLMVNPLVVEHVNGRVNLLRKGLFVLLLGFFAQASLEIEAAERHRIVRCLLNVTIYETAESISRTYSLSLSSGKMISVNVNQMLFWDRENSELFMQKVERTVPRNVLEFGTCISKVVSEGLLWDKEDKVGSLCELIKLGFLVGFEEDAVNHLMKSKNLEIFEEDEGFLSEVFSSK